MEPLGGREARKKIAFITSAFLSRIDLPSSFDFFATLTSEVIQSLQNKYDVVVRIPKPDEEGENGIQQQKLLVELLNGSSSYDAYVISPIEAEGIASVICTFLNKHPGAQFFTVDQSLKDSLPFKKNEPPVPPSVVPNNSHGGQEAARSLWEYYRSIPEKYRPAKPKFIVLTGTGESKVRLEGFRKKIKKSSQGRAIVSAIHPDKPLPYTRDSAYNFIREQLLNDFDKWKDVVGIFACNDELALGAHEALQQHLLESGNRHRQLIKAAIVGFDGIRDVTRRIGRHDELWILNTVKTTIDAMARQLNHLIEKILVNKSSPPSKPVPVPCALFKSIKEQSGFETLYNRRIQWAKAFSPKLCPEILVVTVKEEEKKAIRKRLRFSEIYYGHNGDYSIYKLQRADIHKELTIAVAQVPEQGVNNAQNTTRDAIEDLNPKLIVLVGIGGARPDRKFTLGDVLVCKRVHDLTMAAHMKDSKVDTYLQTRFSDLGGSMHPKVVNLINIMDGCDGLDKWCNKVLKKKLPKVELKDDLFYGLPKDIEENKRILEELHHSGKPRQPIYFTGSIASSGNLVKNTKVIKRWSEVARDFVVVDMELPGVYIAAKRERGEKIYPVLAIRGISDVVGYDRDDKWTDYACETAAAFFVKLARLHPNLNPDHFLAER